MGRIRSVAQCASLIALYALLTDPRHIVPSPVYGGGIGRGMQQGSCVRAHPLPTPPPQAGEGADRVCRSR
jgi:hypothetical protein